MPETLGLSSGPKALPTPTSIGASPRSQNQIFQRLDLFNQGLQKAAYPNQAPLGRPAAKLCGANKSAKSPYGSEGPPSGGTDHSHSISITLFPPPWSTGLP